VLKYYLVVFEVSYILVLSPSKKITLIKRRRAFPIISIVITLTVFIFLCNRFYYVFVQAKHCDEDFMLDNTNRYFWLFDSSKIVSLKCEYPLGNSAERKYRFLYTYNDRYRYWIIEDANLNTVTLNNISDTFSDVSSSKVYIDPSEINDVGWGGDMYFKSKLCIDSSNILLLNFSEDSKVAKTDTSNRISFTGLMKNILIQNDNKENQYLIKYDKPTQTTILFYKPSNILYLIIINAFKGIEGDDIGIENLNLK